MPSGPEIILAVGAHPDDVELMCGGTLARHAMNNAVIHILTLADGVTSREGAGRAEMLERNQQAHRAAKIMGAQTYACRAFPDNRLDTVPLLTIIKTIAEKVEKVRPTIVYTHYGNDLNVDHRIVSDAAVAACRPDSGVKLILFGEVPSATDYQSPYRFAPNWFEDISSTLDKKMAALRCYPSEMREFPHSRSPEAIAALATWRGAMVSCHSAEAFVLGRKIC